MEDEGCVWVPRLDPVNDALCIRQAELAKLLWRQVVRPRVEQLHYLQWRSSHSSHLHPQTVVARWSRCCRQLGSVPDFHGLMVVKTSEHRSKCGATWCPNLRAAVDLVADVHDQRVSQPLEQLPKDLGVVHHDALGVQTMPATTTWNDRLQWRVLS
jgi:hypothetical protein